MWEELKYLECYYFDGKTVCKRKAELYQVLGYGEYSFMCIKCYEKCFKVKYIKN